MSERTSRGGCQCGAVRYIARGEPKVIACCHCPSCRKSLAAPVSAWVMFDSPAFQFEKGEPKRYASSQGVERSFCGECGTALTYTSEMFAGVIDVTVGSLDAPESMAPQMHIWTSTQLPWLRIADGLPTHTEFPPFP